MTRCKSGIPGLDSLLHGGFIQDRPYVISGPAGSGKSIMAFQFLAEGVHNAEPGLFVSVDRPISEVKVDMQTLGVPTAGIDGLDATPDIQRAEPSPILELSSKDRPRSLDSTGDVIRKSRRIKPRLITILSLQNLLLQTLRNKSYGRIVIDSITSLEMFCATSDESGIQLQSFLRFLADSKATVLYTVRTPEIPPSFDEAAFLARGEIRLQKSWSDGNLKRSLKVLKFRGSHFSRKALPFRIEKGGVVMSVPDGEN